ncbi:hypothetical protein U1Q18_027978, partial [Sarracenia purpurea var. burkii]
SLGPDFLGDSSIGSDERSWVSRSRCALRTPMGKAPDLILKEATDLCNELLGLTDLSDYENTVVRYNAKLIETEVSFLHKEKLIDSDRLMALEDRIKHLIRRSPVRMDPLKLPQAVYCEADGDGPFNPNVLSTALTELPKEDIMEIEEQDGSGTEEECEGTFDELVSQEDEEGSSVKDDNEAAGALYPLNQVFSKIDYFDSESVISYGNILNVGVGNDKGVWPSGKTIPKVAICGVLIDAHNVLDVMPQQKLTENAVTFSLGRNEFGKKANGENMSIVSCPVDVSAKEDLRKGAQCRGVSGAQEVFVKMLQQDSHEDGSAAVSRVGRKKLNVKGGRHQSAVCTVPRGCSCPS